MKEKLIIFPLLVMVMVGVLSVPNLFGSRGDISTGALVESTKNVVETGRGTIDYLDEENEILIFDDEVLAEADEKLDKAQSDLNRKSVDQSLAHIKNAIDIVSDEMNELYLAYPGMSENQKAVFDNWSAKISVWNSHYEDVKSVKDETGGRFFGGISGTMLYVGLILGVILFALVLGVNFMGSGMSNESIGIAVNFMLYLVVWVSLSGLAYSKLQTLPMGSLFWGGLTLMYLMGVIINYR